MEKEVVYYKHCFVCGPDNPIGLKLRFVFDGNAVHTRYKPSRQHEGYRHIAHGGLIATILDEVMIKAALAEEIYCVTAQIDVRYKVPVSVETELNFEGRITGRKGRMIKTEGAVKDDDGTLYADARGTYMTVSPEMQAMLLESLEE
jgi:acyl-coenzyme A thioesterase PaaI-like protein